MVDITKSLLLVQKTQRVLLDEYYREIAGNLESCEIRWLSNGEQNHLERYLEKTANLKEIKTIVLFVRFKKEIKQADYIKNLPGLFIIEHDACQNYMAGKYRGVFSEYYQKMPSVKVISSGYGVTQKLRKEGVNAFFVPKGYEKSSLYDQQLPRDIELGFLGSTRHKIYAQRKKMLLKIKKKENLVVARTQSGSDYCEMLNRIKFFVSPDVGVGEYMIKSYEAMACGCILFAWDQGEQENHAVGFRDMKNVVLFSSVVEFQEKLAKLRDDHDLATSIADSGKALVEKKYSWGVQGRRVAEIVKENLNKDSKKLSRKNIKTLVIIPYFGSWPKWINVFVESCRANPGFDWLILSDCGAVEGLPENVTFVEYSYKEYCDLVSRRLGIEFSPKNPYKLCDIKPALGCIHESYLDGYEYWGWSDIDLVYGSLSKYYEPYLGRYNLISNHKNRISGHFCLLRVDKKYLYAFKKIKNWRELMSSQKHFAVDEKQFTKLFIRGKNQPGWIKKLISSVRPLSWNTFFHEAYTTPNCRIPWSDGSDNFPRSWRWSKDGLVNSSEVSKDYPYFHFLAWKRLWSEDNIGVDGLANDGTLDSVEFTEAGIKCIRSE